MRMNLSKEELRQNVLQQRRRMASELRQMKSEAICGKIISLLEKEPIGQKLLCAYMPLADEVDIRPVIEWSWRQGRPVVLPRVVKEERRLQLHMVESLQQLRPGLWGIEEPDPVTAVADAAAIGVVLVPGAVFDPEGGRIGYGGGYYDRLLAGAAGGLGQLRLAPAFELQVWRQRLPLEPHDREMEIVVTESAYYLSAEAEKRISLFFSCKGLANWRQTD